MHLEYAGQKSGEVKLMEGLQKSAAPEMNIYNQAHLELDSPLVKSSRIHEKTNHEIGVMFNLEGELSGKVICLVDLYEKNLSNKLHHFQSLFNESMNILLGQMLTSLEEETEIMSLIGHPQIISTGEDLSKAFNSHEIKLSVGYKLLALREEFTCRIYILANRKPIREV